MVFKKFQLTRAMVKIFDGRVIVDKLYVACAIVDKLYVFPGIVEKLYVVCDDQEDALF